MKANWKDARKEWPSSPGMYWAVQNGRVGARTLLFENDKRGITHWAEIEYPEPPEEEKKMSELEKWASEETEYWEHEDKETELIAMKKLARKLIEVMEKHRRYYPKQDTSRAMSYDTGYAAGLDQMILEIKLWCGEL